MKNHKEIAVLMSLYRNDNLKYVSLSVQSILSQTYQDFDFYIQYDGPINIDIDKYLSNLNDKRIIIRRRHINKGLAYSLNELLDVVLKEDYKFIARMDADDISLPERLEKQIMYLSSHLDIDCIGTWAIVINSNGEEIFRKEMPETHEGCLKQFKTRDCVIHPSVMFRKRYLEKAGRYAEDTYFAEDTLMWAQGFASGCKIGNIPEFLFKFRFDDNFLERRRGWKYAKGIYNDRHKVNKMLGFGIIGDVRVLVYAVAKLMPKSILNILYKLVR